MRLIIVLVFILSLAALFYVGATGYFLARTAAGILTVGPLAAALSTATPPGDPMEFGYRGTPTLALSLPFQTIAVQTALGPAEAWLVPAAGKERGRAVYIHGIGGAREDGYRYLSALHEAGWSVLLITYRNDPGAPVAPDGRYSFGLQEWPDLEAALLTQTGPDGPGVLVVADSMGAAILGQVLKQSSHAALVKAVALDSPAVSYRAVVEGLADQGANPLPGATTWAATLMLPALTGLPLEEAEVSGVFESFRGPLFLAQGTADRIVPIGPTQALAKARATSGTGETATFWTSADHMGSFKEDPQGFKTAFTGFLAALAP